MLWYKSWLETRSRFLIGLALLLCSAGATALTYPTFVKLLGTLPAIDTGTELGRRINEAANLGREYRGYVWSQVYAQNLIQLWTIFAVILGTGGLLAQASGGGALFTLSLPASRGRLTSVRAATGLAELGALALAPSLLIPLLAPVVGQAYAVGDALAHAFCLFVAGAVFFSLAFLLSTVFSDIWRPLLIALLVAGILALAEMFAGAGSSFGLIHVMNGERYFRGDGLPWTGLFVSVALSAAMLYGAAINLARRDF